MLLCFDRLKNIGFSAVGIFQLLLCSFHRSSNIAFCHYIIPIMFLRGSVVLFDLRNVHRGTPNRSEQPRPIMYMSYTQVRYTIIQSFTRSCENSKEWFMDQVNFKLKQSSKYDTLNQQQQKLLSRQDHAMYVQQLEELVREGGHDISALQSDGKYIKSGQHA